MKKTLHLACMTALLGIASHGFATPAQPSCLQTTFGVSDASSQWYTNASILVKNNCSQTVDLSNAAISFKSNSTNIASVWTWPFTSSNTSSQNGTYQFTLLNQNTDPWSSSSSKLTPNQSISLNFGITLSGQAFALSAAQQSLQVVPAGSSPVVNNGEVDITINPKGTTGITGTENITLSSGTYTKTLTNATWGASTTYPVNNLAYGTYTITADSIGNYDAVVTPSTITINGSTPQSVTVTYKVKQQTGKLNVTLPQAPIANVGGNTVITVKNLDTNQVYPQTVNWSATASFPNLPVGNNYSVQLPALTNGIYSAIANPISNISISAGATQNVNNITYQTTALPTIPVEFVITNSSSNKNATVNVQLTDTYGNTFGPYNLSSGTSFQNLPLNDSVNVTASAQNVKATVTPSSFTVNQSQTVTIQLNDKPAYTPELAAYWAGWMGYQFDLNNTYGNLPLTKLYLAFANYANGKIDTVASGSYTNIPAPLSQIQPTYQNWTTYAYHHPQVKMIMSLGGATYSAMWSNLNSMEAADTMAKQIVAVLTTQYPVYAASSANNPSSAFAVNGAVGSAGPQYGNSALLGTVELSGVDLDVEVSDAATLKNITPYVVELAAAIHKAAPTKVISFATFSVAADPAGACTVPGSAHCGEALPLIEAINANADKTLKDVVFYNVMAYDAGVDFVNPTTNNGGNPFYQKALRNYAIAVGDPTKVILGLDLQGQWGLPTSQTCEQLSAEAQWAYKHPEATGGTFLWEIGDDSQNCKALPALQGMQSALNQ